MTQSPLVSWVDSMQLVQPANVPCKATLLPTCWLKKVTGALVCASLAGSVVGTLAFTGFAATGFTATGYKAPGATLGTAICAGSDDGVGNDGVGGDGIGCGAAAQAPSRIALLSAAVLAALALTKRSNDGKDHEWVGVEKGIGFNSDQWVNG